MTVHLLDCHVPPRTSRSAVGSWSARAATGRRAGGAGLPLALGAHGRSRASPTTTRRWRSTASSTRPASSWAGQPRPACPAADGRGRGLLAARAHSPRGEALRGFAVRPGHRRHQLERGAGQPAGRSGGAVEPGPGGRSGHPGGRRGGRHRARSYGRTLDLAVEFISHGKPPRTACWRCRPVPLIAAPAGGEPHRQGPEAGRDPDPQDALFAPARRHSICSRPSTQRCWPPAPACARCFPGSWTSPPPRASARSAPWPTSGWRPRPSSTRRRPSALAARVRRSARGAGPRASAGRRGRRAVRASTPGPWPAPAGARPDSAPRPAWLPCDRELAAAVRAAAGRADSRRLRRSRARKGPPAAAGTGIWPDPHLRGRPDGAQSLDRMSFSPGMRFWSIRVSEQGRRSGAKGAMPCATRI